VRALQLSGVVLSLLGCSVLYDPPAARQCFTDADCESQPELTGLICDGSLGVCVDAPALAGEGCESTALCQQQNSNQAALCRFPGSPCVRLQTPECPLLTGNWQAPNALILGSVGPHRYRQADGSVEDSDYVERLVRSIDLAAEEWQQEVPTGLPLSRRPLAILHCDSESNALRAQRVMDHLVNEVNVPVVFALGDTELGATLNQAVDSGTALVCVECYDRAELAGMDNGLLWRMLPPFETQAPLAAWRVHDLELRIRAERVLPSTSPLRVALISDDRAAFNDFSAAFRDLIRFNGNLGADANGANYLELRAPDPRTEAVNPLMLARRVVEFAPDIVVAAVDDNFSNYYLRIIEQLWRAPLPRPYYVATLLNQELGLLESIVGDDEDLRLRLSGTGLFEDAEVARNRQGFQARYRSRYAQDPGRTQTGYDAFYATALAIFASDLDGQLNGEHISGLFGQLMGGAATDVDPRALGSARAYLVAKEPIDLVGASSHLDWDPTTRQVRSDVGLWCITRQGGQGLQLKNDAGPRWAPSGTTGTYDCP
jgi:hypothetical protein